MTKGEGFIERNVPHGCAELLEPVHDPQPLFRPEKALDTPPTFIRCDERACLEPNRDSAPVQIGDDLFQFVVGGFLRFPGKVGDPAAVQIEDLNVLGGLQEASSVKRLMKSSEPSGGGRGPKKMSGRSERSGWG